jgi:enoyl-CoA hydratase/carnithine racemase
MIENSTIRSEQSGSLLTILLPDPSTGGLSREALTDLASALEAANDNDTVSVLVLIGGRTAFCYGLDLDEFAVPEGFDELAAVLRRCFRAFARLDRPLIVVVEGPAIGFGASLISYADVVVATPAATFEAPFVGLGLLPEAASTLLLPQRIGYLRAIRFLCLGESIGAEEARACGFVTEVAVSDPRGRAIAIGQRLTRLPADAVRTTRRLMRGDLYEIDRRIELELSACRRRLDDPKLRRRVALFATAARSASRRTTTG